MRSGHKQFVVLAGLATVGGALMLSGCTAKSSVTSWQVNGTPVHDAPTQPWWNYELVYHPNSGVYYEPYSSTYHWQEAGEWRSSKTRPEPVAWRAEEAIVVKLNWDTPEYGHTTVAAVHPNQRTWNRTHPITVDPAFAEDTALTKSNTSSETKSAMPESYTIQMPKSATGTMHAPHSATAAAPKSSPKSESTTPTSEPESTEETTTVAGATSSDNPE